MNSILSTAKEYYNPSIVKINTDVIATVDIPNNIKTVATVPVKYEIENTPLFWISSIIVFDTLNYQFWSMSPDGFKRYEHLGKTGAMAMGTCFWDAWHDAIPEEYRNGGDTTQALGGTLGNFRSRIEKDGIQSIFGDIPDPESRKRILFEVMKAIPLLGCANLIHCQFKSGTADGEYLARILANDFPASYLDVFLKKAQLTLMLASAEYRYRHPEANIKLDVTIAADYQIPKVLRSMGILEYSDSLANLVDNEQLIAAGSKEELAIRAASILAGEEISKKFGIAIPLLDWWIWSHRNDHPEAKFHLTLTTDY